MKILIFCQSLIFQQIIYLLLFVAFYPYYKMYKQKIEHVL